VALDGLYRRIDRPQQKGAAEAKMLQPLVQDALAQSEEIGFDVGKLRHAERIKEVSCRRPPSWARSHHFAGLMGFA
jgi:hypothetical protein